VYTYLRATLEIAYDISRVLACKTRRTYAHTHTKRWASRQKNKRRRRRRRRPAPPRTEHPRR
jgi:hypothetical protein